MRNYYIYKVTNKINGKIYIGKTINFVQRIMQHTKPSEGNTCEFHKAILEYGICSFTWEVECVCNNEDEASEKEYSLIKKYGSVYPNGYNMTLGKTGGIKHDVRPIVCLTLDGEYVNRYESASQAEKDGYNVHSVLNSCRSNKRRGGNNIFMFEDEYIKSGGRKYEKPESSSKKPIIQCDLKGNFIAEYESVTEAAEITGLQRTSISSQLTGKRKTTGNFIFVYKNDFPIKDISKFIRKKKGEKVYSIDTKTNKIVKSFSSTAEAGRELGVNYKAIHKVLNMPNRTAYGFKWISQ